MRKGVESLCGIVRTSHMNPLNGDVYVFTNKSRCLLKMLHWERGGFVVYYKRFERKHSIQSLPSFLVVF